MSDSPLLYALTHHAKELMPIAGPLAIGVIDLERDGWETVYRWKNCVSIKKNGTELHFRYERNPLRIIVLDDLRPYGKVIRELRRELDVMRFIRQAKKV